MDEWKARAALFSALAHNNHRSARARGEEIATTSERAQEIGDIFRGLTHTHTHARAKARERETFGEYIRIYVYTRPTSAQERQRAFYDIRKAHKLWCARARAAPDLYDDIGILSHTNAPLIGPRASLSLLSVRARVYVTFLIFCL